MKYVRYKKSICAVLICVLIALVISSCGASPDVVEETLNVPEETSETVETSATDEPQDNAETPDIEQAEAPTPSPAATLEPSPSPTPTPAVTMTQEQQNSINMLNYLTVLVQEIRESKNSRLYLESAYSELINNTEPSIVDDLTLDEYEKILTVIENYRMTAVQRERLQYIYEQNSAASLRSAIPNPLAVLNVVQARNPLKTIVSLAYMAIDSSNSYSSATQQLDLQYLQDGWALDDKESANLNDSRTSMFSYMVRVARNLPTGLTLNEDAVNSFVEWKNKDNVTSRIRWLESNKATYQFFGEYWLVLADSYYENEDYEKCLESVAEYEALDNSIFRKDIRFAQTLPYAVVSAQETLDEDAYVEAAAHFARLIVDNTYNSDWSLRYFAAQTYVDLYVKTNDRAYLQKAFDLAYDNVNELVPKQSELNRTYLADVVEVAVDSGASKDEKAVVKAHNQQMKEMRKTELPPVYEPLRLNCELLFVLADELDISQTERSDIDKILHPNGEMLFLNVPLDAQFHFATGAAFDPNSIPTEYSDGKITAPKVTIPALYVPDGATVTVTISSAGEPQVYEDWTIDTVDRQKSDNPEDFVAIFTSSEAKHADYEDGDVITVTVSPSDGQDDVQSFTVQFQVHKTSGRLGMSSVEFERVNA